MTRDRVVILGAGRSVTGDLPSALVSVDPQHRVMDWLLSAFSCLKDPEIAFVSGFKAEEISRLYPEIRFFYNSNWANSGPVRSLSLAPIHALESTYICYADILFRPDLVKRLANAPSGLSLAIDSQWRKRYEARSENELSSAEKIRMDGESLLDIGTHVATAAADAEFVGLMRLSGKAIESVQTIISQHDFASKDTLPHLVKQLSRCDIPISYVDALGDWAELNAPQDRAKFVLGTKAESLERLAPLLKSGEIGGQVSFTTDEWLAHRNNIVTQIQDAFGEVQLVVRSSALREDGWVGSSAGAYTSRLDVNGKDRIAVASAIDEVVASFGAASNSDQVLVQAMLKNVVMNGVVMTRTTSLGAPYYVFNFDDSTGRTDSVTAGKQANLRTIYLLRGYSLREDMPESIRRLLQIVNEAEALIGHDSLDIEFAFTEGGVGHLLQVRPIAVSHRDTPIDDGMVRASVDASIKAFRELQTAIPFVEGYSTVFSNMADWNPAEMVGSKPSRLANSLYKHLITNESWAQQRAEYGYRDVRPNALIVDFAGHPFVDLRVDFNSFIPAALPTPLARRLVDYYLDQFKSKPSSHDKVEFDIVLTCLDFNFEKSSKRLRKADFTTQEVSELRDALYELTKNGIKRCPLDVACIANLNERFEIIKRSQMHGLNKVYCLIEDVRRNGIPLFAHLARHGFVAISLLNSLVDSRVIGAEERDRFLGGIQTVSKTMQREGSQVANGQVSWEQFVATYGHLRPGSYDITSRNYASNPDMFLRPMVQGGQINDLEQVDVGFSQLARTSIEKVLSIINLFHGVGELEKFLHQSIQGRELGKFVFMRYVNEALEELAEVGDKYGLSREDLSHITISEFFGLREVDNEGLKSRLESYSSNGRNQYFITNAVNLPGVILSEQDFYCYEQLPSEPNFITGGRVQSNIVKIDETEAAGLDLSGLIVLIENADPGYDWLFARGIGGLVTMYGGVNSHMSIRAAEHHLPAAIGVGELLFDRLQKAKVLELDCAKRRVRAIH